MKPTALAPLLAAALLAPVAARAHGVSVDVDRRDGGVAARVRYEGGPPLAGARYEIVSPARPGRAFEEGLTDRHGWAAFVPDAPGTWRVRIVDASGHGHVAEVEVGAADLGPTATSTATPTSTPTSTATPTSPPTSTATATATTSPALRRGVRTLLGAGALALAFAALHAVQRRRRGSR